MVYGKSQVSNFRSMAGVKLRMHHLFSGNYS